MLFGPAVSLKLLFLGDLFPTLHCVYVSHPSMLFLHDVSDRRLVKLIVPAAAFDGNKSHDYM